MDMSSPVPITDWAISEQSGLAIAASELELRVFRIKPAPEKSRAGQPLTGVALAHALVKASAWQMHLICGRKLPSAAKYVCMISQPTVTQPYVTAMAKDTVQTEWPSAVAPVQAAAKAVLLRHVNGLVGYDPGLPSMARDTQHTLAAQAYYHGSALAPIPETELVCVVTQDNVIMVDPVTGACPFAVFPVYIEDKQAGSKQGSLPAAPSSPPTPTSGPARYSASTASSAPSSRAAPTPHTPGSPARHLPHFSARHSAGLCPGMPLVAAAWQVPTGQSRGMAQLADAAATACVLQACKALHMLCAQARSSASCQPGDAAAALTTIASSTAWLAQLLPRVEAVELAQFIAELPEQPSAADVERQCEQLLRLVRSGHMSSLPAADAADELPAGVSQQARHWPAPATQTPWHWNAVTLLPGVADGHDTSTAVYLTDAGTQTSSVTLQANSHGVNWPTLGMPPASQHLVTLNPPGALSLCGEELVATRLVTAHIARINPLRPVSAPSDMADRTLGELPRIPCAQDSTMPRSPMPAAASARAVHGIVAPAHPLWPSKPGLANTRVVPSVEQRFPMPGIVSIAQCATTQAARAACAQVEQRVLYVRRTIAAALRKLASHLGALAAHIGSMQPVLQVLDACEHVLLREAVPLDALAAMLNVSPAAYAQLMQPPPVWLVGKWGVALAMHIPIALQTADLASREKPNFQAAAWLTRAFSQLPSGLGASTIGIAKQRAAFGFRALADGKLLEALPHLWAVQANPAAVLRWMPSICPVECAWLPALDSLYPAGLDPTATAKADSVIDHALPALIQYCWLWQYTLGRGGSAVRGSMVVGSIPAHTSASGEYWATLARRVHWPAGVTMDVAAGAGLARMVHDAVAAQSEQDVTVAAILHHAHVILELRHAGSTIQSIMSIARAVVAQNVVGLKVGQLLNSLAGSSGAEDAARTTSAVSWPPPSLRTWSSPPVSPRGGAVAAAASRLSGASTTMADAPAAVPSTAQGSPTSVAQGALAAATPLLAPHVPQPDFRGSFRSLDESVASGADQQQQQQRRSSSGAGPSMAMSLDGIGIGDDDTYSIFSEPEQCPDLMAELGLRSTPAGCQADDFLPGSSAGVGRWVRLMMLDSTELLQPALVDSGIASGGLQLAFTSTLAAAAARGEHAASAAGASSGAVPGMAHGSVSRIRDSSLQHVMRTLNSMQLKRRLMEHVQSLVLMSFMHNFPLLPQVVALLLQCGQVTIAAAVLALHGEYEVGAAVLLQRLHQCAEAVPVAAGVVSTLRSSAAGDLPAMLLPVLEDANVYLQQTRWHRKVALHSFCTFLLFVPMRRADLIFAALAPLLTGRLAEFGQSKALQVLRSLAGGAASAEHWGSHQTPTAGAQSRPDWLEGVTDAAIGGASSNPSQDDERVPGEPTPAAASPHPLTLPQDSVLMFLLAGGDGEAELAAYAAPGWGPAMVCGEWLLDQADGALAEMWLELAQDSQPARLAAGYTAGSWQQRLADEHKAQLHWDGPGMAASVLLGIVLREQAGSAGSPGLQRRYAHLLLCIYLAMSIDVMSAAAAAAAAGAGDDTFAVPGALPWAELASEAGRSTADCGMRAGLHVFPTIAQLGQLSGKSHGATLARLRCQCMDLLQAPDVGIDAQFALTALRSVRAWASRVAQQAGVQLGNKLFAEEYAMALQLAHQPGHAARVLLLEVETWKCERLDVILRSRAAARVLDQVESNNNGRSEAVPALVLRALRSAGRQQLAQAWLAPVLQAVTSQNLSADAMAGVVAELPADMPVAGLAMALRAGMSAALRSSQHSLSAAAVQR